jgi:hypothetical protein
VRQLTAPRLWTTTNQHRTRQIHEWCNTARYSLNAPK